MNKDLITAIGTAVIGVIIAYFVTNLIVKPADPITVKTIDSSVSASIDDPSPEIFNYLSLNPTVEVYVGDCTETNEYGECVKNGTVEVTDDDKNANNDSNDDTNSNNDNSNTDNSNTNDNTDNSSDNSSEESEPTGENG